MCCCCSHFTIASSVTGLCQERIDLGVASVGSGVFCPPARGIPEWEGDQEAKEQRDSHHQDGNDERRFSGHQEHDAEQDSNQRVR